MALTKAEMSEYLFDKLGLSKRDAKELVELFFEEIRRALENGEQVKLSGFGNFDLRDKNQRPGPQPEDGGRYSHYSPPRGDLQTRPEVKKPCRKRNAQSRVI